MIPGLRTFKLGVKSLSLHKLRSALTMLGILFGVASVIAMLSVGEGTSQKVQDDIRSSVSTNILLRSRKPPEAQCGPSRSTCSRPGVRADLSRRRRDPRRRCRR